MASPFFLDKKRGEKNQAPEFKFTQNIGMPFLPRNQCSTRRQTVFGTSPIPSTWLLAHPRNGLFKPFAQKPHLVLQVNLNNGRRDTCYCLPLKNCLRLTLLLIVFVESRVMIYEDFLTLYGKTFEVPANMPRQMWD